MVLGLRSKNRRGTSILVDYIVELREIKPWPPSPSLKSIHSVVLQWENGDKSSGSTNPSSPSLSEGKIEFNESFKLQVSLMKEGGGFQKNILQIQLYEMRKEKAVKGQHLGIAALNLADYGIIKDSMKVGVPINLKRSFRNYTQPVLYVKIQGNERNSPGSSSRESLSKDVSLDKDGKESVSALMSEEYAEEEAEIASFTDEDVSLHSSLTIPPSVVHTNSDFPRLSNHEDGDLHENGLETAMKERFEEDHVGSSSPANPAATEELDLVSDEKQEPVLVDVLLEEMSTQSSPVVLSHDRESKENGDFGFCDSPKLDSFSANDKVVDLHEDKVLISTGSLSSKEVFSRKLLKEDSGTDEIDGTNSLVSNLHLERQNNDSMDDVEYRILDANFQEDRGVQSHVKASQNCNDENDEENENEKFVENDMFPDPTAQHHDHLSSSIRIRSRRVYRERLNSLSYSAKSSITLPGGIDNEDANQYMEDVKEIGVMEDVNSGGFRSKQNTNNASRFPKKLYYDNKVDELERKIKMLEGELRDAAAVEMGLYAMVAEHGSSTHKVHTPARRLWRLYFHASKLLSGERRASAAKNAVSGLVLVAKACGNDVPRLTFWLSNSIVLRAMVNHATGSSEMPESFRDFAAENVYVTSRKGKKSQLKWESTHHQKDSSSFNMELHQWEDPQTFAAALEKVETWIFSRIIESVWWQTLTPHMQSWEDGEESKDLSLWNKKFERESSLDCNKEKSYSCEIWNKAFQDVCERLCPVRAERHECGCLPIIAKLVMEQCVARLDVAMFNAILRQSDEEIPTDPVADPVSNCDVLPVTPGKLSFGAGAQVKNAIGSWSRLLTDLFGMDVDESSQGKNDDDDERVDTGASLKSFHLLNSLSDLLMLPKDMLLEDTIRKEMCSTFSSSVIERILVKFLPDEFCSEPVPASVFKSLESEDPMEINDKGTVRTVPCSAYPITYSPPSVSAIESIIRGFRSKPDLNRVGSLSVFRKSHTSDDELDELDSPLSAIILDRSSSPAEMAAEKMSIWPSFRHQLLRDVWRFDD
ncbi:hypothetical protein AXF42_Ash000335 [Apostasia shenzhenica]|uniref:C2 NT-type domain-containing protein n=1 Tax=Apostasia shenzhenica TaxID=1088818 RepID=A0A2I0AG33_9ASPA|nr:hypothetical protein AXF42_Ash000335 [Apostasia shenzhenica]